MKQNAYVIGVGMTRFGKHLDKGLKELAISAITDALHDAGIDKSEIEAAYVGNASQGVLQGQESIRGQVVLHAMGIGGMPIVNLENACASSATALNGAMAMINAGEIECDRNSKRDNWKCDGAVGGTGGAYSPDQSQIGTKCNGRSE